MDAPDHVHAIRQAVARQGWRARRVDTLSPTDPRKRGRALYTVALDDGTRVKARWLESAAAVEQLLELRARVEPAFSRALAGDGRVLLEEWVDGRPLRADERIAEAGALLGRLHATPGGGVPGTGATGRWRARAEADLATLRDAGALTGAGARALAAGLARDDPDRAPQVLAHRDFCAENMLVDARGALRVIDNELVGADAAALDLARVRFRWPLDGEAWVRFLRAYRAAAPGDPGPLAFWETVALAWSARARLDQPEERLAVPLLALREKAARGG